ncbi:Cupredoxin superfamily protein [Euphorbia peplus]|nr:Cupredoxin superfamily protein [Euphorbia peplus]
MGHQGYRFYCVVILHLLALYLYVDARTTYTVGDTNGWTLLSNFPNWVRGKEFNVGDVLGFNYEKELHNVMQVNSTAYERCIVDVHTGLFSSGNDSIVLSKAGKMWFVCGVGDHCQNGQKLAINVLP